MATSAPSFANFFVTRTQSPEKMSSSVGSSSSDPSVGSWNPSSTSYGSNPYDSCTFVGPKYQTQDGCYMYRSCQSCLQTLGCLINDYGICVSESNGMYSLPNAEYAYNTAYNPSMNHLQAYAQNLVLPNATKTNVNALSREQNWHFRSTEAVYCAAADPVCEQCKKENFWRSDADALPDSRFCVGENGCVCIQTCEVPTYKTPGCQWKLSTPSNNYPNYGGYGGYTNEYVYPTERVSWWEWLIIVAIVVLLPLLLKACCRSSREESRDKRLKEVARLAVLQELGIPEPPAVPVVVISNPQPRARRQDTILTEESLTPRSLRDEDLRVYSPHAEIDFIELEERRSSNNAA